MTPDREQREPLWKITYNPIAHSPHELQRQLQKNLHQPWIAIPGTEYSIERIYSAEELAIAAFKVVDGGDWEIDLPEEKRTALIEAFTNAASIMNSSSND